MGSSVNETYTTPVESLLPLVSHPVNRERVRDIIMGPSRDVSWLPTVVDLRGAPYVDTREMCQHVQLLALLPAQPDLPGFGCVFYEIWVCFL